MLAVVGFELIGTERDGGGFQRLIDFTTPVFWSFLLLSGALLFMLRRREPAQPRPFRVPWYPLVPLLFCCGSGVIVYSSVMHAIEVRSWAALWAAALMAPGVLLCAHAGEKTAGGRQ